MLDVTNSQVDVKTNFGGVSLILTFCKFCFDKMIFSVLEVCRDLEKFLTASARQFSPRGTLYARLLP